LLFAPDDRQALASALNMVIGDGELRARLSANALAKRPHIGWDARARSLLSAIEAVLAGNVSDIAGRKSTATAGAAMPPQPAVANCHR